MSHHLPLPSSSSRRLPRLPGWVPFAALPLLALGCAVPQDARFKPGPVNACTSTSACGAGATCVQSTCVATDFDLAGLLIEVRPHSNATFGATTSYLLDPAQSHVALDSKGTSDQTFLTRFEARLPKPVAVRGGRVRVNPSTTLEAKCSIGSDRSIPAHVTFYRVPPFAGLPFEPIPASAQPNGQGAYALDVDLVPDIYDIYIEPQALPDCNEGLPYPPVFIPRQALGTADALSLELPVIGTLKGTITGFGADASGTWAIDLVEPTRGLPISANGELVPIADGFEIKAQIAWQDKAVPIVRLKPSAPAQPTAFWALDGSVFGGTQQNPEVAFTVDQLFAKPVQMSGQVLGTDNFTRIRGSITIQSNSLWGPNAENAAFRADSVETDEMGVFTVSLPPGDFAFRVSPVDNGLAVTDVPYMVPIDATCFCGKPFTLSPKLSLTGTVTTPTGEPLTGASVDIGPSQSGLRSFWESTHSLDPLATRAASTTTDIAGSFELLVDPGSSDLVIQTDPGSGFPWLVQPRRSLAQEALDLGALAITSPAILSGTVRDPSGLPVANAEVNAWFPVRDPSKPGGLAGTVVKIATTSTDENGSYTLIMPSSI